MPIMNLDSLLDGTTEVRDRILRVGVELEGAWTKMPKGMSSIPHDGSVSVDVPLDYNGRSMFTNGEIPSPALQRKFLGKWMQEFFPQYVNKSCGLHVHMSFANARYYTLLMNIDYQETLINYLLKWAKAEQVAKTHTFFDRMAGRNTYCKLTGFAPDLQAAMTSKSYSHDIPGGRYTALNYTHGQHGTIECRLLPMFDSYDLSLRAVERVLDITNASLVFLRRREGPGKTPETASVPLADVADINEHAVSHLAPHSETESEVFHL